MTIVGSDRHAYDDAGSIMMLFRSARTRAVARGSAVLVSMTANGTTDRGTFMMYEACRRTSLGGLAQTPVATCKTPTTWLPLPTPQNPTANPNVTLVDGVNLNDPGIETQADIETQLLVYPSPSSSTAVSIGTGYVCYTPLGHTYVTSGAGATPAVRRRAADHQPHRGAGHARAAAAPSAACSSPPTAWRASSRTPDSTPMTPVPSAPHPLAHASTAGYTAVEVLMAMTVMVIGAAAVISMQKTSIQGNLDARKTDIANSIGARGWSGSSATRCSGPARARRVPSVNNMGTTSLIVSPGNVTGQWFLPDAVPRSDDARDA